MRTLGIVPARAGSKRLAAKNLRLLAGKPLVRYAIEAASQATTIDQLVVSSDDPRVLEIASKFASVVPIERPPTLAADRSPAIDYVRHALETVENEADAEPFEAVVIVQPTSPLTLAKDIDRTVELLCRSGADSAVTVQRLEHAIHPLKLKTLDGDRLRPYLEEETGRMAEHQLPPIYIRNGSVYASRRQTIETGDLLGADSRAHLMPRERSIDINDAFDLKLAELLLADLVRSSA